MTYIDYLNTFNRWLESNTLPGNAQLLFFRFLNVFNRAGWPEQVQVDILRLMIMSDSKSEKTARTARDKLVEAGLIGYHKGKKGSSNSYFLLVGNMVKNSPEIITINDYQESDINPTDNTPSIKHESCQEKGTHIKTNKDNNTKKNSFETPFIPLEGYSQELQETFDDWLKYKKEKNQPYKPTGLKSLVTKVKEAVSKYGEKRVIVIIKDSMSANYQGILWDKLEQKGGQSYGQYSGYSKSSSSDPTKPKKLRSVQLD